MAKAGLQGGEEFIRDVVEWASMADAFVSLAPKTITPSVTQSARRGEGPGGVPYPKWSEAYEKLKANASGSAGEFLWGLGKKRFSKGGASGHMLDDRNFKWEKIDEMTVQLVWTASGKAGDYARAHNEGLGDMPKREWMHLLHPSTLKLIDSLRRQIGNTRSVRFSAKWGR